MGFIRRQFPGKDKTNMENLCMLLYLAVALVVGATTSTAYINPMEDYRESNAANYAPARFPWLQRPIFYESAEHAPASNAAPEVEEVNDVNEVNVESIGNRQMPSYADVGRFLLKRNVDILNDPRFLNCIQEMDIVNHPSKLMPAYARCASVIGRPRFGKRSMSMVPLTK